MSIVAAAATCIPVGTTFSPLLSKQQKRKRDPSSNNETDPSLFGIDVLVPKKKSPSSASLVNASSPSLVTVAQRVTQSLTKSATQSKTQTVTQITVAKNAKHPSASVVVGAKRKPEFSNIETNHQDQMNQDKTSHDQKEQNSSWKKHKPLAIGRLSNTNDGTASASASGSASGSGSRNAQPPSVDNWDWKNDCKDDKEEGDNASVRQPPVPQLSRAQADAHKDNGKEEELDLNNLLFVEPTKEEIIKQKTEAQQYQHNLDVYHKMSNFLMEDYDYWSFQMASIAKGINVVVSPDGTPTVVVTVCPDHYAAIGNVDIGEALRIYQIPSAWQKFRLEFIPQHRLGGFKQGLSSFSSSSVAAEFNIVTDMKDDKSASAISAAAIGATSTATTATTGATDMHV